MVRCYVGSREVIHQETAETYHARKAVSAGFLWRMVSECPAQAYYESCFNPDAPPQMRSLEFDIGSATHLLTLEGAEFAGRATLIPYETYQSKDARELRDRAYIDNRTPLRPKDYRLVCALHDAIRKSDVAELLFAAGQSEVSYTWKWDSVPCKARADRITPHAIVDLKTAASASPGAFQRALMRDGHHLRAAWYLDGWEQTQYPHMDYVFVVVAKTPPHLVEVYQLDEHALQMGRRLYRTAMRQFRECQETGIWPGYKHKAGVGLPTYEEYRLAEMEADGELDL